MIRAVTFDVTLRDLSRLPTLLERDQPVVS